MTRQPQLIALLAERDMGIAEIAESLAIDSRLARRAVAHAKKREAVHVHSWALRGGKWAATYRIGAGPDAARPVPLDRAAANRKNAAYRARLREVEREPQEVARHAIEIAMYGGPASVAVRIPPVPAEAWEAA